MPLRRVEEAGPLKAYELQRQERIASNQIRLRELGLPDLVQALFPEQPRSVKARRRRETVLLTAARFSARLSCLSKPSYTEEVGAPVKKARPMTFTQATFPQQQASLTPSGKWKKHFDKDDASKALDTPVRQEAAHFSKRNMIYVETVQQLDVTGAGGVVDAIKDSSPLLEHNALMNMAVRVLHQVRQANNIVLELQARLHVLDLRN